MFFPKCNTQMQFFPCEKLGNFKKVSCLRKKKYKILAMIFIASLSLPLHPCDAAEQNRVMLQPIQQQRVKTPAVETGRLKISPSTSSAMFNTSKNRINETENKTITDTFGQSAQDELNKNAPGGDAASQLEHGAKTGTLGPGTISGPLHNTNPVSENNRQTLGQLGLDSGTEGKLGQIESRLPSAKGSGGGIAVSNAEGDSSGGNKSAGAQAGSAAAGAASDPGKSTGEAVGDAISKNTGSLRETAGKDTGSFSSYGKTSAKEDYAEWLNYQSQGKKTNSSDDTDRTGEGNSNLEKAQTTLDRAQQSRRSASYQIIHGSGEKPGADGAPAGRIPVKKAGPLAGFVEHDEDRGVGKTVKLPPHGPGTYDPAAEGIGDDVQPK